MDKRNERTALLAGTLATVWLIVDFALSRVTQMQSLAVLVIYPALALAISGVVCLRERFARRADEEKRESALLAAERTSGSFFDQESAVETFAMGQTHRQFERFVIPAIAPLIAILLGWWLWQFHRDFNQPANMPMQRLLAIAFLGGEAFTTFLLSRYLLGLSRNTEARLLRGPGVALGITSITSLVAIAAALAGEIGYPPADRIGSILLAAFLAILAIESFINFLAELYKPRRKDGQVCRSYESRLGGLLAEPGKWARNVAGSLDYQFGFKVSETWLYHFLEDALLPLVIFQILALYLLSCLVFLAPDEEGILERFGKPVAGAWHLDSGLHFKFPWPFETVRRFPAKRVISFHIGQGDSAAAQKEPPVITWSVPHVQGEERFLVASQPVGSNSVPVNLIAFNIPVEYQITNIYQFAYQNADAPRLVQQIAYRSLTQEAATRDLFDLMGDGQNRTAQSLWNRIQTEVDRRQLGVKIVFVGLQGVHPPTEVAEAFESVVGALQQKEATILAARAYAVKTVTLANADASKATTEATAYEVRRKLIAEADAKRFLIQNETASKSPQVFRENLYLNTLESSIANARKYIVPTSASNEVIQLNFEQKWGKDLFDLSPTPAKKE